VVAALTATPTQFRRIAPRVSPRFPDSATFRVSSVLWKCEGGWSIENARSVDLSLLASDAIVGARLSSRVRLISDDGTSLLFNGIRVLRKKTDERLNRCYYDERREERSHASVSLCSLPYTNASLLLSLGELRDSCSELLLSIMDGTRLDPLGRFL